MFDVGAAIGDTVLLIKSNCPGMVSKFYCIEGDIEFFKYLTANMECFNDVECINTLLSDSQAPINSLVRTHSGTASAQGNTKQDALMLDTIIEQLHIEALHLLKIDTDGYDGKILTGAAKTLDKFHPVVIFEWHPILCGQVGTDYKEPFKRLSDFGYTTFIWYTKKGNWSHFTFQTTDEYLNQFAEICQKATFDSDWHYDIVALHNTSKLSILEFANSDYSRKKQSPF
jgi:FkbM family methyltransferase